MDNVMLDLETMGNKPGCKIMSIGACRFNPQTGEIGDTFHKQINLANCPGSFDASTVLWWMHQDKEAQQKFYDNDKQGSAAEVIGSFMAWLNDGDKVWGNGSTFDNSILKATAGHLQIPVKWKFWNDRDVRTVVDLGRQIGIDPKKDMPFDGVKHDALADAIHQAKYVSLIIQKLTEKGAR